MIDRPGNSGAARVELDHRGELVLETLDGFCLEKSVDRLDVIKIDVEGFEERVLKGGERTLTRCRPTILIELNPTALTQASSSPQAVVELLQEWGYCLYETYKRVLRPLVNVPSGEGYVDVFCVHREKVRQE